MIKQSHWCRSVKTCHCSSLDDGSLWDDLPASVLACSWEEGLMEFVCFTAYIGVFTVLCILFIYFFLKPCLTDLVQPAQRGSAGAPKKEADHTAAARYRIFNCADKQRQHSWRSAATGVCPHCPWPNQHQAHHLSAPRWQDDNQPDQVPEYSTCKVSTNKHALAGSFHPG